MKNDRVEIREDDDNLSIIASDSLKNPGCFGIIMTCFVLCLWLIFYLKAWTLIIYGKADVMNEDGINFKYPSSETGFYLWLFGWTVMGLYFLNGALSFFVKHELIITNKNTAKYKCHLLGFNIKREVFFENIKNIHIRPCSYYNFFQKNWHSDTVQGYLMLRLVLKADDALNLERLLNKHIQKNRLNS